MQTISKDVASQFCKLCNWAYETWATHKRLFDDNASPEKNIDKAKYFMARLSIITQEYSLLQIAKLHDPAKQGQDMKNNLTIDYIVKYGDWNKEQKMIENLQKQLSKKLYYRIKDARNKTLAHNDLDLLSSSKNLGAFPDGDDIEYFALLQQLANKVSGKWLGSEVYPFNNLAIADVDELLRVLGRA